MQRTIYQSPIFGPIIRVLAGVVMRAFGWKAEDSWPGLKKAVVLAVPHTSNWDLFFCAALCYELGINFYWMGKHTLFPWPVRRLMLWSGGIPVDRSQGRHAVKLVLDGFKENEEFILLLPPEGTRKRVSRWKSGFYRIADEAGVPIVCGYLDYARKVGGFGPVVETTGDFDADVQVISEFYQPMTAKYPDNWNKDALLSKAER